jgi:hypothetical protein
MLADVTFLSSALDAAHHSLSVSAVHGAIDNPLDDIFPNFTIFGAEFTRIWQKIAAGLWGLGILIAVGFLGHGILGIAQNRGGHPGSLKESKKDAQNAGIALGGLIALAPIVGVFIAIFS